MCEVATPRGDATKSREEACPSSPLAPLKFVVRVVSELCVPCCPSEILLTTFVCVCVCACVYACVYVCVCTRV